MCVFKPVIVCIVSYLRETKCKYEICVVTKELLDYYYYSIISLKTCKALQGSTVPQLHNTARGKYCNLLE